MTIRTKEELVKEWGFWRYTRALWRLAGRLAFSSRRNRKAALLSLKEGDRDAYDVYLALYTEVVEELGKKAAKGWKDGPNA
jgi:hypothetical protein